jgi:hypothetical protein
MFSSIVEVLFAVGAATLLYQIFLSDYFRDKRIAVEQKQSKYNSIDKVARVKLISDDPKDIEYFITTNAQYLSDDMVERLVSRIEDIKADQVVNNTDNVLKSRIDRLFQEETEDPVVVKRASRKK